MMYKVNMTFSDASNFNVKLSDLRDILNNFLSVVFFLNRYT